MNRNEGLSQSAGISPFQGFACSCCLVRWAAPIVKILRPFGALLVSEYQCQDLITNLETFWGQFSVKSKALKGRYMLTQGEALCHGEPRPYPQALKGRYMLTQGEALCHDEPRPYPQALKGRHQTYECKAGKELRVNTNDEGRI